MVKERVPLAAAILISRSSFQEKGRSRRRRPSLLPAPSAPPPLVQVEQVGGVDRLFLPGQSVQESGERQVELLFAVPLVLPLRCHFSAAAV